MGFRRYIFVWVMILLFFVPVSGQEAITLLNKDYIPPAPSSSAFKKYMGEQPALSTGSVNLSIPLYELQLYDISIPFSLKYNTGGIKVYDDPYPCGFGWSILPALKITRTIMGRPDEYFVYVGDQTDLQTNFTTLQRCMTNFQTNGTNPNRYDSQYDIFTVGLLDGNYSYIIDKSDGYMNFIGVGCSEIKISADSLLSTINVVDASGVKYRFTRSAERCGDFTTCLAWVLSDLTLTNGKVITFYWGAYSHPTCNGRELSADSFEDSFDYSTTPAYASIDSSYTNNNITGELSLYSNIVNYQHLDSVIFEGGNIKIKHTGIGGGAMIKSFTVTNHSDTIKHIQFEYGDDRPECFLLKSLTFNDEGIYKFQYNPNRFRYKFTQDYWGYYNEKLNGGCVSRVPTVRIFVHSNAGDIGHFMTLESADRSIDREKMQANILTCVTYPTGGKTTFEYEPHRFSPMRMDSGGNLDSIYDPKLSEGGGLRVTKITTYTSDDDTDPVIRRYVYGENENGLAYCRAVPSLATFIDCFESFSINCSSGFPYIDYWHRKVNINPGSNYMKYDIGQTPIWYKQVTEYHNEGKIIYKFKDFLEKNRIATGFGYRYIIQLNKVFSKGPQLVQKSVYRQNNDNTYTEVHRTTNSYKVKYRPNKSDFYSTHISRNIIQSEIEHEDAPDFNENGYVKFLVYDHISKIHREQIVYCDQSNTYHASLYDINVATEQLTATTTIDFMGNGNITNSTSYGYLNDSKLIDCVVKSSSENSTEKLQLYYTNTFSGTSFLADSLAQRPILLQMRDSNIIVPVISKITNGSATITAQNIFGHKGNKLYLPYRTLQCRGNNASVKELCRYDWDALGNMRSRTYPDKSKEFLFWGYNGRFLLFRLLGADYASLRGPVGNKLDDLSITPASADYSDLKSSLEDYGLLSSFEYKPMIGLSESVSPCGEKYLYDYDDCNRLAYIKMPPYGILKKFEYNRCDEFVETDMRKWGGNYVVTREYIKTNKYLDRVDYFDGLGRPYLSASIGITPAGNDLYELTEYDNMGRESAKWLPAVCDFGGARISKNTFKSASASAYSDNYAFDLIEYECSPRGQPSSTIRPGAQWHSADKNIETIRRTNSDEPRFCCRDYSINADGSLLLKGNYHAGKLYITETIDEDGHIAMEFKNLRGNIVLKRNFLSESQTDDTYYVYDDFDDLRYILSPMLSERLTAVGGSWSESNDDMARWGYYFSYDDAGNCVYRKLPGCNACHYIYDKGNRLIAERDGAMGETRWKVHFYDKFSREVITGIMSATKDEIMTMADTIVTARLSSTYTQLYGGYEFNITLPAEIYPLQNITYYDTYSFFGNETAFDFESSGLSDNLVASVKGRKAGVLQYDSGNGALLSVFYYNVRGNIIQQRSQNFLGGMDEFYCSYSYTGKPEEATEIHSVQGDTAVITRKWVYYYDDADRLLKVTHRLNDENDITIAQYVYDELGRVSEIGNAANETAYEYTTQGWIKKIENNRFVQELSYEPGCYNGNISSNLWGDKQGTTRRYDYSYDNLNRLTSAVYVEPTRVEPQGVILDAGADYSAYFSYDLNGNILSLARHGIWDKCSINDDDQLWCFDLIDDLEFHYDGNRLLKIDDFGVDGMFEDAPGFIDGNTDGNDYTWNGNGSMTSDLNTGISRITYNDMNLPHFVTFNDGHQTVYVYSCDGRKLQATYQVAVTATTSGASTYARYRTEMIKKYCGDYIYENDTLKTILFDGGYIDMSGRLPLYHFYTHDYQGNIRVEEDILGLNVERYDYYPYGALFGEKSPSQNYLYGGKEWERSYGMNHYDFHARWMNPLTTRFTTQDPLQLDFAELSSYSYCAGNPILYIDPTGKFWETLWDIGNLIYDVGAAVDSHIRGYHDKATEHWIDAGVDLAATLIPFVPAGGSKLARMADDVVDATYDASKTADNVTAASNAINKVADATTGQKQFITYTKKNPITGEIYSGRTSGYGDPNKILRNRDLNHHKNKEGFNPAIIDKISNNPDAIRGREQFLIEIHGGAKSQGGTSGNAINGINKNNPKRHHYEEERRKEFED